MLGLNPTEQEVVDIPNNIAKYQLDSDQSSGDELCISGKVSSTFLTFVNSYSSGSEITRSRRRISNKTCLRYNIEILKIDTADCVIHRPVQIVLLCKCNADLSSYTLDQQNSNTKFAAALIL